MVFGSVAADGFGAPGVVVSYTDDPAIQNGSKFAAQGMQIAAGVPLQCDEPEGFSTFRLGLFGLDTLYNVEATLGRLKNGARYGVVKVPCCKDTVLQSRLPFSGQAEAKLHNGLSQRCDTVQPL